MPPKKGKSIAGKRYVVGKIPVIKDIKDKKLMIHHSRPRRMPGILLAAGGGIAGLGTAALGLAMQAVPLDFVPLFAAVGSSEGLLGIMAAGGTLVTIGGGIAAGGVALGLGKMAVDEYRYRLAAKQELDVEQGLVDEKGEDLSEEEPKALRKDDPEVAPSKRARADMSVDLVAGSEASKKPRHGKSKKPDWISFKRDLLDPVVSPMKRRSGPADPSDDSERPGFRGG